MGLQLFKSPPVPSVYLLCMWVQTRQPLLVSGRSVLISLMCNLLGQHSLWHLSVLWLFLRAGKLGLHGTQDLCVCTYPSIPRITGRTDLQTPLLLCSVLRSFLRNRRYPETPHLITAPKPSGTAADRGVLSTRCIHVPFAASWNLSFRFQMQLLKFH